jgi:hypothetical protein
MGTQAFAALLCGFGLLVPTLSWSLIGLVWVYNLAWMLVLEIAKLAVCRELDRRAAGARPFSAGSRCRFPAPPSWPARGSRGEADAGYKWRSRWATRTCSA